MTRLSFSVGLAALLAMTTAEAAELPDAIKQAGTLRLTVNSTYAPMEYRDPTTNQLVGLDIDLANELAKRLGVKIVWSETLVTGPAKISRVLPHPPGNNGRFQGMGMPAELRQPLPRGLPGEKPEEPAAPPQPPAPFYADTKVIAYRVPDSEVLMAEAHPTVTTSTPGLDAAPLTDGDYSTEVTLLIAIPFLVQSTL